MDILLYISANIEIFLKGLFLVQEMDDIAEIKLRAACYFGFDKWSKVARIPLKQPVPVMSHGHTGR